MKRTRHRSPLTRFLLIIMAISAVTLAVGVWWQTKGTTPNAPAATIGEEQTPPARPTQETVFDRQAYPLNEADSLWAVVNKGRSLPADYVPEGLVSPNMLLRLSPSVSSMYLREDAAKAMERMAGAAKKDGVYLMLASGYRSYSDQRSVYNGYVASHGQTEADTFSARPGHSEHQTGLAADIEPSDRKCELETCFADTPEGKWVAANAPKHGFVIRYPKGLSGVTGYDYEPWHLRYVGLELSEKLQNSGQTVEQFFGLDTYSSYPSSPIRLTAP